VTEVRDNPDAHRFDLFVDGEVAGFAAYRLRPGHIVLTHTEVASAYEGKGLAGRLAAGALDAARERGLRVVPQCPYIARYIQRHPDYADLVAS
jgi:predicted GNAT family acetyltransferase